jgi:[acyl-carrier-protein] S-malonyltransferase
MFSFLLFTAPCSLVINVSAQAQNHPLTFKEHLVLQLKRPVRWRETLLELDQLGMHHFVEVGPGKVLT